MQQSNNGLSSNDKQGGKLYHYDQHQFRASLGRHEPTSIQQNITQTKNKLHSLIEELNGKLMTHFHTKEQQLLNQYKRELVQAQKELTELKNTTNQDQIRSRMTERKLELEKQRQELIQTNMFFSNKCQNYKHKLTELVSEGQGLEKEIIFLEAQLQRANQKKLNLMDQLRSESQGKQKMLPITVKKKKTQANNTQMQEYTSKKKVLTTFDKTNSVKKISNGNTRVSNISKGNSYHIRQNLIQNGFGGDYCKHLSNPGKLQSRRNRAHSQIAQKTQLQQIFQKTVQQMRDKRHQKKLIPSLNGEQFTDFQKKLIMQQFLSRQEVKRKIYEIIFDNMDQTPKLSNNDNIISNRYSSISDENDKSLLIQDNKQRSRERTIRQTIILVQKWRKLHELTRNNRKINLQQSAIELGVSKKSLDDYFYQLRLGEQLKFPFRQYLDQKVGILRSYVKQHKKDKRLQRKMYPKKLRIILTYNIDNFHYSDNQQQQNKKIQKIEQKRNFKTQCKSQQNYNNNRQNKYDYKSWEEIQKQIQNYQEDYCQSFNLFQDQPNDPFAIFAYDPNRKFQKNWYGSF